MIKVLILLISTVISHVAHAEEVTLERDAALKMLVSSYVNGFKEFDTTVIAKKDGSVSIGIYVEREGQSREKAEFLARIFRKQVPVLLQNWSWAKGAAIKVTIY